MVELLAVVVILAVLLGLLFPVLRGARRSAHVSVDAANLRQIGLALHLYGDEWNVEHPVDTGALVRNGRVPVGLFDSPLDPTSRGIANARRAMIGHPQTAYRDSYLTIADEHGPTIVRRLLATQGAGVMIALGEGHPIDPQPVPDPFTYRGDYLRLLTDGAVVHRKRPWRLRPEAQFPGDVQELSLWRFTDEPDAVKLPGF